MQTVITKKIDGIDIVSGFGKLSIDPMATRPVVTAEIQKTDEFKAVKSAQDKRNAALKMAGGAAQLSKKAKNKDDKQKHWDERLNYLEQANGHENEIKGFLPELKKRERELRQSQAVYFEPKAGEILKTDSEISNLKEKMVGSVLVSLDGDIIPDNRGITHCTKKAGKWAVVEILTLNVSVPTGAVIYADLDEAGRKEVDLQVEIDVASKLSAADKVAGKAAAVEVALSNAASLRSRLEISGSADPLTESQEFYSGRLAEIDLIYG